VLDFGDDRCNDLSADELLGCGVEFEISSPPLMPQKQPDRNESAVTFAPMPVSQPTILVFDSGLGGLTVYREIVKARPDAAFVYVADDAFFPYGKHGEDVLAARIVPLMGELIEAHRPDLLVIACNTASTLVMPHLRERYSQPFVGTVPAIKPACAGSRSRMVSVLGTEATVKREYTRKLIRDFAGNCEVALVGSGRLAALAEAALNGEIVNDADILREIEPCFRTRDGARTDTVVLACTHYPLLLERLRELAPWPVDWIDPAPAIARRVGTLLGPSGGGIPAPAQAIFTSGRPIAPPLRLSLASFGLGLTAYNRPRNQPFDEPLEFQKSA
jgi:glutamate racemase